MVITISDVIKLVNLVYFFMIIIIIISHNTLNNSYPGQQWKSMDQTKLLMIELYKLNEVKC